jgi:hypothetical protein
MLSQYLPREVSAKLTEIVERAIRAIRNRFTVESRVVVNIPSYYAVYCSDYHLSTGQGQALAETCFSAGSRLSKKGESASIQYF